MIVVEVRFDGGGSVALVNPGVTQVEGLDAAARRAWANGLVQAFRAGVAPDPSVEVVVEIEGKRQPLTSALAHSLAIGDAARSVIVFADDLPGAKPRTTSHEPVATAPTTDDLAGLEANVASAEAKVAQLKSEQAAAARGATEAVDAFMAASHRVDKDAAAVVAAADERHGAATKALAEAREALGAAESAAGSHAAARQEASEGLGALQAERAKLETDRTVLVSRMVEAGDPGDPAPVESALAALRRLRQVKRKPSSHAVAMADRWVAAGERLAAMPQPPQPPEWLVIPALAALHEAREAVAAADVNVAPSTADPSKVEALDRAHREVLEAEQRSMRKGSRIHRRRLEAAHAAEQVALTALGVKSYGEYLQRMAPGADSSGGPDRLEAAKAGLHDAEAVWEELHGGQASPEWTTAKEEQAAVRAEAHALLGHDVDDGELEAALRSHLEAVVETGWAEGELVSALQQAGVTGNDGDDLEALAERWLAESPEAREKRALLVDLLDDLDTRLAAVETKLEASKSDAFFGPEDADESTSPEGAGATEVERLAQSVTSAEQRYLEAEMAVVAARQRLVASQHEEQRLSGLEADADARRNDVDAVAVRLHEAEATLDAMRSSERASTSSAVTPDREPVASPSGVDLSAVVGMEAEAYLLVRVAALRGVPGGPLPLVVDVDAVAGLSDGASRRVLRLLGRLAGSMQIVVLGDDEKIATWTEGLGDQAGVRAVAR